MRRVTLRRDGGEWRSDATRVAVVDLAIVVGLIVVGQLSHDTNPLADPLASIESIVPFVVGWVVVAGLAGLYGRSARSTPTDAARAIGVCWLAAANVGFLLRGSPAFAGEVPWDFTVVLTGIGLVVFVTWRVGYAMASAT